MLVGGLLGGDDATDAVPTNQVSKGLESLLQVILHAKMAMSDSQRYVSL